MRENQWKMEQGRNDAFRKLKVGEKEREREREREREGGREGGRERGRERERESSCLPSDQSEYC